jgi:hypothetical protein
VELPFLQTILSSFQVVPLVVGDAPPQDVAHLLDNYGAERRPLSWSAPICPITTATRLHSV